MNHMSLEHYLQNLGFSKEEAQLIGMSLPKGSFSSTEQVTQLIGKALLQHLKVKKFTIEEFTGYLNNQVSITNARKYLCEARVKGADKTLKVDNNHGLLAVTGPKPERIR